MGALPHSPIPGAIQYLEIIHSGNIELSWINPADYTDGSQLNDLLYIVIYKDGEYLDEVYTEAPGGQASYTDEQVQPGQSFRYQLIAENADGLEGWVFETAEINYNGNGINTDAKIKEKQNILRAYPNPFNPTTTLSFDMTGAGKAKLEIYSMKGRLVYEDEQYYSTSGKKEITWNACGLASGVYFCSLYVNKIHLNSKKIILVK